MSVGRRSLAPSESQLPTGRRAGAVDLALGARIRAARAAAGLSLEQLAARLQLSTQQIFKYECGTNRVTVARLIAIADALGVEIAVLLGRTEGTDQPQVPIHHDDIVRLVTGFCKLKNPASRDKILEMVEFFAGFDGSGQ